MADLERTDLEPKAQLAERLAQIRAGMLGVPGSGMHEQPMTHFHDEETGVVWFITSRDTDLVRAVGSGAEAHYCIVSPKTDYYACLRGRIVQTDDEKKLDELWTSMAAAWFDAEGREDHDVTLLRLDVADAAIWSTTRNPLVFGLEMARSIGSDHRPEVGEHVVVNWARAA